jgi:hypothetical protein
MFLDVSLYRKEVLSDELGSRLVFVGLGIQPSAGSSHRSRAEIQQHGARLLLGCGEGRSTVTVPGLETRRLLSQNPSRHPHRFEAASQSPRP